MQNIPSSKHGTRDKAGEGLYRQQERAVAAPAVLLAGFGKAFLFRV